MSINFDELWKKHGGKYEVDGNSEQTGGMLINSNDFRRFCRELESTAAAQDSFDRPTTKDAFVRNWDTMVATVSTLAAMYDMPKPQMVFHPKWHERMNALADVRLAPTIIYMDVKIRFGMFEPADVLRIA